MTTDTQLLSEPEAKPPPLRRATYIHVSDLTNVYNIDHALLEQELSRVRIERQQGLLDQHKEEDTTAELARSVDPAVDVPELDAEGSPQQKRLLPPKGGYNLCVRVGKVLLVVDKKRVDQSRVRLAEVEVGDETGVASLRARDSQIDLLSEVADSNGAVVLRNCTIEIYKGKHIRLAVTKWGKLSPYPDNVASTPLPPSKMNLDRDFSSIDLSLVASQMMEDTPSFTARHGKQADSSEGSNNKGSKRGTQNQKQPPRSSGRSGDRKKRQPKGKQGHARGMTPQPYYGLHPYELGGISPRFAGEPRSYPDAHTYPAYEQQPLDNRHQYHYSQHQEHHAITPASAQHMMMQRQYGIHQQQLQHARGQGTVMMQPLVAAASYDTSEYTAPPYPSTSPILVPVSMSGAHINDTSRRGDSQGPSSTARETTHSPTHFMSVSPDDSSQISARMNPDASSFAPSSYLEATQASNPMYFGPYDHPTGGDSNNGYPPLTTHAQMVYPRGTIMYNNTTTPAGTVVRGGDNPSSDSPLLKDNTPKGPATTEHQ